MTSFANAFEPSSRAAAALGPKQATPAAAQVVGEPGDERRLGPDHDEVHAGELALAATIVGVARDAGVARRGEHLRALRRAHERPHDRVLAAAGADDEDPLHRAAMKSSIGIAASDS